MEDKKDCGKKEKTAEIEDGKIWLEDLDLTLGSKVLNFLSYNCGDLGMAGKYYTRG